MLGDTIIYSRTIKRLWPGSPREFVLMGQSATGTEAPSSIFTLPAIKQNVPTYPHIIYELVLFPEHGLGLVWWS